MSKKHFGLALGGGGVRGLMHIGVLKTLEAAGLVPGCLSGTSMGGIISAAYAAGMPLAEMEKVALRLADPAEVMRLLDLSILRGQMQTFIAELFNPLTTFAELKMPLALAAVDLLTTREVALTEGSLLPAVLATCAVPGLFPPQNIPPYHLVDGAFLNNIPVGMVRALGADVVLAVDAVGDPALSPHTSQMPILPNWPITLPEYVIDLYWAEVILLTAATRARLEKEPPELLLAPRLPDEITLFLGFTRVAEIIDAGETAARQILPELEGLLSA